MRYLITILLSVMLASPCQAWWLVKNQVVAGGGETTKTALVTQSVSDSVISAATYYLGQSFTLSSGSTENTLGVTIYLETLPTTMEVRLGYETDLTTNIQSVTSSDLSLGANDFVFNPGPLIAGQYVFGFHATVGASADVSRQSTDVYAGGDYTFKTTDWNINSAGTREVKFIVFEDDSLSGLSNATLRPTSDSYAPDWTSTEASDYEAVDEVTSDDDTTYTQTSTASNRMELGFEDLASCTSVTAVILHANAKAPTAATLRPMLHVGAAYRYAPLYTTLGTSYGKVEWNMPVNPVTGTTWTCSDVDGIVGGVQTGTVDSTVNVTQVWAEVIYE